MKRVLIVVDMQNDFITGSLANKGAQIIVPNVVNKVKQAIESDEYERIFFTMDTHYDGYLNTEEGKNLPIEHCMDGTWGREIIDELQPYLDNKKVTIYEKDTFGSIDLAHRMFLCDKIEIIGVCTDICVVSNALLIKAFTPNTPICVIENCCAGTSPKNHEAALQTMRSCQIEVI